MKREQVCFFNNLPPRAESADPHTQLPPTAPAHTRPPIVAALPPLARAPAPGSDTDSESHGQ